MSDSFTHLVGRVGVAPSRKSTSAGNLAEFRLAVDGDYDVATKSRPTTWYDVTAWAPLDDSVMDNIGVGTRVWVSGVTSVFKGTTGDRWKIKAREVGLVDKLMPGVAPVVIAPVPSKTAKVPEGVTFDAAGDGDW